MNQREFLVQSVTTAIVDQSYDGVNESEQEFGDSVLEAVIEVVDAYFESAGYDDDDIENMDEDELDEAMRKIQKLVGGRLKTSIQKLAPLSVRKKARRKYRKNRSKILRAQRVRRKKSAYKKHAKKRALAVARSGGIKESAANVIKGLLQESSRTGTPTSDVEEALSNVMNTIFEVSSALADFFTEFGLEEDIELGEGLTDLIENMNESVEDSLDSRMESVQAYALALAEAVKEFDKYKCVGEGCPVGFPKGDDDDDDYDDEEDYDYDDEDGEYESGK